MSQVEKKDKVLVNNGRFYWRSVEQVEGSERYLDFERREFSEEAIAVPESLTRRSFSKVLASSLALAGGLVGCRRPEEKIFPYAKMPEEVIPGKPLFYATSSPRTNGSIGLLVKSNEGRPIKIEGLPDHPVNKGKTDHFAQADILDLYDPHRLQYGYFAKDGELKLPRYKRPLFFGIQRLSRYDKIRNQEAKDAYSALVDKSNQKAEQFLEGFIAKAYKSRGEGLAILTAPTTSDSEKKVYRELRRNLPKAKVFFYEPLNDDFSSTALKLAYARRKLDRKFSYHFDKAQVIVSIGGDFLCTGANSLQNIAQFVTGRKIDHKKGLVDDDLKISRLYAVEGGYSLTGANAEHRLRLQPSKMIDFVYALAQELIGKADYNNEVVKTIKSYKHRLYDERSLKFIRAIAEDLLKAKGKSLIYVGEGQDSHIHLIALLINNALGNINSTMNLTQKVTETDISCQDALSLLINDMRNKEVSQLLIMGGNPVYEVQASSFGRLLESVGQSIHLTSYLNDTSLEVTCALPESHYLESWGDTRAYDGTKSFVQPLINPLYKSFSKLEILARLAKYKFTRAYDIVKESYSKEQWQGHIHRGFIAGTWYKNEVQAVINYDRVQREVYKYQRGISKAGGLELSFFSDYSVYDGRYLNNSWLQELPDPMTKLCWDNALLVGYQTAKERNLRNEQVVRLRVKKSFLELPVWIVPGMADNTVALSLGYGQRKVSAVGKNSGFNAYSLRIGNEYFVDCELIATQKVYPLANTQDHGSMEERPIIKEGSFTQFKENPLFAENQINLKSPSLFSEREELEQASRQWGMTIDLNSCIGCATCTIACQAENNIPVVGKEQVIKGREMHWIRMDRYFTTPKENDRDKVVDDVAVGVSVMPLSCMHCERAPCEQVCPVAATTHSPEGLNEMTYNRCIGTRYCLNNCPFKVRRFNYFNYHEQLKDPNNNMRRMVYNPNVTMRSRGVMEKCTYCVQRINEAKIDAKVRHKGVLPDFTTACAQSCPAGAIVFGDIKDKESEVYAQKAQSRRYELLPELNIRPRTSYLAKVKNVNHKLSPKKREGVH